MELEMIRERTREGLEAARSKGVTIGRGSTVTPELRARIKALAEAGMAYNAIAKTLNDEGVPTPQGGSMWRASSIRVIVTGQR
jgi:DNA invertase Pin-like site-specific DNA recombinase